MQVAEIAEVAVLMACLPLHINMLESIVAARDAGLPGARLR